MAKGEVTVSNLYLNYRMAVDFQAALMSILEPLNMMIWQQLLPKMLTKCKENAINMYSDSSQLSHVALSIV